MRSVEMNVEHEHEQEQTHRVNATAREQLPRVRTLHFRRRRALWVLGLEPRAAVTHDERN